MAFKDGHDPSIGQKVILAAAVFLGTLVPAFLMFTSHTWIEAIGFGAEPLEGNFIRQVLIVTCSLVYGARFAACLFVFLQRRISWFEGGLVGVLFFMMFMAFNTAAGGRSEAVNLIDILGVLLFLGGSGLNLLADYQRHLFKRDPDNKGKLFTGGLFSYSQHINYFGDLVCYLGLALITMSLVPFIICTLILLNFIFLQIPRLDDHLREKYGEEFKDYERTTKKFIPCIY